MSESYKHCLTIGMGTGLSLAVATRFAEEGFAISALARNPEALISARSSLPVSTAYHGEAADVANSGSLELAIKRCEEKNGRVSVLIYNAAEMIVKPLAQLLAADLRRSLAVNVEGAFVAAQAVLPNMVERRSGTILFTGGGLALNPLPSLGALAVGKAAIRSLALTFAKELAIFDVHAATVTVCGTIRPGTFFAPERIAEVYWQLYQESPGHFRDEVIYREENAP